MSENKLNDCIWIESFRPNKVKDVISIHSNTIEKYLENNNTIPHFLFHSTAPGTGKSSMAYAIINQLKCDKLILNTSDDRKIETVREKVKDFARTKSSNGKRKCLFLDETDGMLKSSQEALRNIMETFAKNCFFILTCNNINKIHDAVKNRCIVYEFNAPDKIEIYNYLEKICSVKGLLFNSDAINKIIDINYPSIRNCVNILQDLHTKKLSVSLENISYNDNNMQTIWSMIKNKKFRELQKYIYEHGVDCSTVNAWLFENIFKEDLELKILIKLSQILARNERDINIGADNKIIFISSLPEIMMVL